MRGSFCQWVSCNAGMCRAHAAAVQITWAMRSRPTCLHCGLTAVEPGNPGVACLSSSKNDTTSASNTGCRYSFHENSLVGERCAAREECRTSCLDDTSGLLSRECDRTTKEQIRARLATRCPVTTPLRARQPTFVLALRGNRGTHDNFALGDSPGAFVTAAKSRGDRGRIPGPNRSAVQAAQPPRTMWVRMSRSDSAVRRSPGILRPGPTQHIQ